MSSIITITFNPSLDLHVSIPALIPGSKLRCTDPLLQPGGGGINVARAVKRLGGEALAIYPAGGDNGKELTRMLEEEGVTSLVIPVAGSTRENLTVGDQSTGLQYRFLLPGPVVSDRVIKDLPEMIASREDLEFLVISGSLSPGLSTGIFAGLAAVADRKRIKLVVDTSGDALKSALSAGVYMIKPSIRELTSLADTVRTGQEKIIDIEALARKLIDRGSCSIVVVSMGEAGALLVTGNLSRKILVPSVKTISTVGAGDSLVAGMVWYLSQGKTVEEAAEYGCACGAAATMNPGTSLCSLKDVEAIYAQMKKNKVAINNGGI